MKKLVMRTAPVLICLWWVLQSVSAAALLVPGGQVIGLQLQTEAVTVAAFEQQLGQAAKNAGLQVGDRIIRIDGRNVHSAEDVRELLRQSDGTVELSVQRGGKTKKLRLSPQITEDGPRLGVYLRQGVAGVGTVTWYDPEEGTFGALGHGVSGGNGEPVAMRSGSAYPAAVVSVRKGLAGEPGQLMGSLTGRQPIGILKKNTVCGVFGRLDEIPAGQPLPVGRKEEIKTGPAVIRSTVSGQALQEYSVEILKIYPNASAAGRNMLLRVTDPRLLEATGGIVQGMSGSPLVQDGKLIGAVTHVLVNDPTMGYGIFIENMLEAAG